MAQEPKNQVGKADLARLQRISSFLKGNKTVDDKAGEEDIFTLIDNQAMALGDAHGDEFGEDLENCVQDQVDKLSVADKEILFKEYQIADEDVEFGVSTLSSYDLLHMLQKRFNISALDWYEGWIEDCFPETFPSSAFNLRGYVPDETLARLEDGAFDDVITEEQKQNSIGVLKGIEAAEQVLTDEKKAEKNEIEDNTVDKLEAVIKSQSDFEPQALINDLRIRFKNKNRMSARVIKKLQKRFDTPEKESPLEIVNELITKLQATNSGDFSDLMAQYTNLDNGQKKEFDGFVTQCFCHLPIRTKLLKLGETLAYDCLERYKACVKEGRSIGGVPSNSGSGLTIRDV